ncbi:MAG: sulfite exporter TauE/SafE family protein [Gammaproteobacteria bacterium]|nr:sulfite exporter TauE/SafE family protein [Gammaproteobacteria bacterium]
MPELLPLLVSAFTLGLLGGGHCIGMCGGVMGALGMAIPSDQQARKLHYLVLYNLGRILSYALAGFLFGLAGWAVGQSPVAMGMRILAGLLLIAMGLYLAGWWFGLTRLEKMGQHVWRPIQKRAKGLMPLKKRRHALLLGALWGWLPCGLVYSTLIWSASQGDAGLSALLMFCFGLGTWPVLIASGFAAERLGQFLRHSKVRAVAGLLVILYGIWTLPGPHHHLLMGGH